MAHLQNADKGLFPLVLNPNVHIPEKGLPSGLIFQNLSENYNSCGISQTPGYKRLCNKKSSTNKTVRLSSFPDNSMDFAILPNPFSDEKSNGNELAEPFFSNEDIVSSPAEIRTVYFNGVASVTNDPGIIGVAGENEKRFDEHCDCLEKNLSKVKKRRVASYKGRRN